MNSEQADILDLLSGHTDDTTIERLAFECLLTNMTDDRVVSLMNILGWQGDFNCFAIGGVPSTSLASTSLAIRKAVRDLGGEHVVIGSSYNSRTRASGSSRKTGIRISASATSCRVTLPLS